MKNKFNFLIISILLVLMPLVSSNGLTVIETKEFYINKTFNQDTSIKFSLRNEETFDFVNVSFEENSIVEMPLTSLLSGEIKNITATIKTNQDFIGDIKIKGFYQSDIGVSDKTYPIKVDFSEGVDICSLIVVEGDQVEFENLVADDIVLRNADTLNDVTTILENNNYTLNFEIPEIFNYYFLRHGFPFTEVCTITSLSTTGLINNPELDDFISLNLKIVYTPTEINTNFPTTYYSLNFDETKADIFTIYNNGNETAKNIELEGEWFTFNPNNFDLSAGESRNIGYTVSPIIITTDQTNKTHHKNITISGNFPAISQEIDIYIKYTDIGDYQDYYNTTVNDDIIKWMIQQYCEDNPEKDFCKPRIIYKNLNETERYLNFSMGEEQWKGFVDFVFETADENKDTFDLFKEMIYDALNETSEIKKTNNITASEISSLNKKIEEYNTANIFVIVFFLFLVGLIVLIVLINKQALKNKFSFLREWK